MSWRIVHNSLLIGRYGAPTTAQSAKSITRRKIAAFDFVRLYLTLSQTIIGSAVLTCNVVGLYTNHVCIRESIWS